MCKRTMCLIAVVMLLGMAGNVHALSWYCWNDGGADNLWSTGANWDGGEQPQAYRGSYMYNTPDANALIDSTVTAVTAQFDLHCTGGPMTLYVTGGSLTVAEYGGEGGGIIIGVHSPAAGLATLDVDGGAISATGRVTIGNTGNGLFDMSGGSLSAVAGICIAQAGTTTIGQMIMSDGTVTLGPDMGLHISQNGGTGSLSISGGTITTPWVGVGEASTANGTWTMTGGTVDATSGSGVLLGYMGTAHLALIDGIINTSSFRVADGGTATVDMDGGTISATERIYIGQNNNGDGQFDMSGGSLSSPQGICIALVTGSVGEMIMSNGTVTLGPDQGLHISQVGGTGSLSMSGGTITTPWVGVGEESAANGTWTMTGGTVDATSDSGVLLGYMGTGHLALVDGIINTSGFRVADGGTATVDMDGGTVSATERIYIGQNNNSDGQLDMSGGFLSSPQGICIALATGSDGEMIMSGGTVTLGPDQGLHISQNGGTGSLSISGGTITTPWISAGETGTGVGTWTMTGGTVNANAAAIHLGYASTAHLDLFGGVINAVDFVMRAGGGTATMDIEVGTLIIDGDKTIQIQGYIDNGWVTGYGNPRMVKVVYDFSTCKTTVTADVDFVNYAYNPSPVNGATDVPIDADISWSPGDSALSHDVYFGAKLAGDIDGDGYVNLSDFSMLSEQWLTNRYYLQPSANLNGDDIVDMGDFAMLAHDWIDDALVFIGNQEPNSYDPALEFGQSYFWRIDEVDAENTWEGRLWSFETQPWPVQSSPGYAFALADNIVYTLVFHWYTSTGGQLNSPWLPLEGRENWTGEPKWWKGQIKQMMASNLDIIFVELYSDGHGHSQQRINLFQALGELRALGYDVPKVAPFLDIAITWSGDPDVDLATEAGKDEFVSHYINFFNDYYSVNTDANADSYIAQIDGRVVLVTYGGSTVTNHTSLSRDDVESRLSAEFGTEHPIFYDDGTCVYKISNWINDSFYSWADEKAIMFGVNSYYATTTLNGIQAAYTKPGYWDQWVRDPGTFLARNGGTGYTGAWNSVNANSANDRVFIESFNEYDEGSGIYAVDCVNSPALPPVGGNNDTWSSTDDPFEYIKTTYAGASEFNNRPDYDSDILWHNIPASMSPSEVCSVMVVVRNDGDLMWTGADDFCFDQLDTDGSDFTSGRCAVDDSKNETSIYGGIFRGRVLAFEFDITAPSTEDTYVTNWSMIEDGGTPSWFGETLNFSITVE